MKKLLVCIVAIVLVAAVFGTCFALYYENATDKVVSISAGYQAVNLIIKNGTNTGDQGNISLTGFNPTATTQTVDVGLAITNPSLADGVHGVFSVSLTGDLAAYIDKTAYTLSGVGGSTVTNISATAFSTGYDVALTSLAEGPLFVRLTFTLNAEACADFSLAAEKTAALELNWLVNDDTVWALSEDKYYVAGILDGVDKWDVNYENQNPVLTSVGVEGDNIVQILGIHLTQDDQFKVVKGQNSTWYDSWEPNDGANGDYINNSNGQITIEVSGTYNIYLADKGNGTIVSYIDFVSAD